MITASMNRDDFVHIYKKDLLKLTHITNDKGNVLIKEMRKGFRKKCIACYDITTNNATYKMILRVEGKVVQRRLFIIIPETKEYVCIPEIETEHQPMDIYTVHCLKRIQERFLNQEYFDVNKCLVSYFNSNFPLIPIYCDGEDMVSVVKGGLLLQKIDETRNLIFAKTFVNFDMLGEAQRKAFEQVETIYERYNGIEVKNYAEAWKCIKSLEMVDIDEEYIYQIYGEYFSHKRNVKKALNVSKGITE
jgi:hypothetical protein